MSIDIKEVQKLRQESGYGVVECKKALEEAQGDVKKANEILKKAGAMKAQKKAEREIKQGLIEAYVHCDKVGALIALGCETDFVARNEGFKELAHDIAMQVVSMDPKDKEELLSQSFVKDPSKTIKQLIEEKVGQIGENIQIIDFKRLSL